jgi:hypothetical protein
MRPSQARKSTLKRKGTAKNINIGPANLDMLEEDSDSDVEVMRVDSYGSYTNAGPGMQALMDAK